LAAILHIDRSTVIRWEAGEHAPQPYLRPRLARVLGRTSAQLGELIDDVGQAGAVLRGLDSASVDVEVALNWIDLQAGWPAGTSRQKLSSRLRGLNKSALQDRNGRRARVGRRDVAQALADYYLDTKPEAARRYRARVNGQVMATSIICRPEWQDLLIPLAPPHERLNLTSLTARPPLQLDNVAAEPAVRRVAESVALNVRLTDDPVYQLLSLGVQDRVLRGTFGLAPFVEYALTADLLEGELFDAIIAGKPPRPGNLPLRDRYLRDVDAVLDPRGRLCAGGVLALCAIARPSDQYHDGDYLLLVQERSGHVLNAAHRLAVIPKGFHKPLADYRADTHISATLHREMEQELFGRADVDSTVTRHMSAAPMHPSRLSEPMRWLTGSADALRTECTGFTSTWSAATTSLLR
jgi:hypothetical protein